ncbi:MAG: AAA family ATPase, partial [Planctomycetia bacterium]
RATVDDAAAFFERLIGDASFPTAAVRPALDPIRRRLDFLREVGLGYLPLDRAAGSLSIGEARRATLAAAFAAGLARTLYVLDEPTAGLHPGDVGRLLPVLRNLTAAGNTVVCIEHSPEIVAAADWLLDVGPGAGGDGGRLSFAGPPTALGTVDTPTARCFGRPLELKPTVRPPASWLRLLGCRKNNLRSIEAALPLGVLAVVCGVSGAGKSSLVFDTLCPAVAARFGEAVFPFDVCDGLEGGEAIDEVVAVDADAIGRTSRGNAATFLKVWDEVRKLFADTLEARSRGWNAGRFSFNTPGGRCERCEGQGFTTVDMQFLPEVRTVCADCGGRRYDPATLEVKYRGRSAAEVLEMTPREAFAFFRGEVKVQVRMKCLLDVGLDYLPIGQPLSDYSGGEAKRLKLAAHLALQKPRRTLFLFEEPTVGLHPADVAVLLKTFDALLAAGHSLIVVDNHADVLAAADWLVELGPGAGPAGGTIVAEGPPSVLMERETPTARFLRRRRELDEGFSGRNG